jgi:hypothetical protein
MVESGHWRTPLDFEQHGRVRPRNPTRRRGLLGMLGMLVSCSDASPLPDADQLRDLQTEPATLRAAEPGGPAAGKSAPVRRLTNSEYVAAVRALFNGVDLQLTAAALPSAIDVDGFDNNVDLSAAYPSVVEAYHQLAIEVSSRAWRDLALVSGCEPTASTCIRNWVGELGAQVAWRTDADTRVLATFDEWSETLDLEQATRLSIQLLLISPDFTYAPRSGNPGSGVWTPLDARPLARRLALLLWNAPPDQLLLEAADRGELEDPQQVRAQALRMLDDSRAHTGALRFYEQLLEWQRVAEATLDPGVYLLESPHIANDEVVPRTEEFTGEYLRFRLQPAMRAESQLFVEHHLFEGEGTLAALLTATESFATWDLAQLVYGGELDDSGTPVHVVAGPVDELAYPMFPFTHDPSERAGLLTLAAFVHGHAGPVHPSPVRRGAFVMSRFLCQPPAAPPDDVPPLIESETGEPLTNRERFAAHTDNPACQSCHKAMDAIGFTFEGFDSLGAVRTQDAGQPVDSSGALFGTDKDGPLVDALDLAHVLASSRTVHDCHVLNWFRYAFGRTELPADDTYLASLEQAFWAEGGDVQALIVAIVMSDEFRSWRSDS